MADSIKLLPIVAHGTFRGKKVVRLIPQIDNDGESITFSLKKKDIKRELELDGLRIKLGDVKLPVLPISGGRIRKEPYITLQLHWAGLGGV